MIDVHAHVLPGLDDGAENMDIALEMAALAVESGVTMICATPHSSAYGRHKNHDDAKYRQAIKDLQQAIDSDGLPLKVLRGMEVFGTFDILDLIKEKKIIGLNDSRYVLIEFPFEDYAAEATEILEELIKMGKVPLVAHPERYQYVLYDPQLLNLWTELGCLFQINKGSLLGRFGRRIQAFSWELLMRGFACVVASDAHSSSSRSTWMKEVEAMLLDETSKEETDQLLKIRPRMVVENQDIVMNEPDWF